MFVQRSDNLERHEAEHEQREPPKRTRIGHFIEEVINKCQAENSITGVLTGGVVPLTADTGESGEGRGGDRGADGWGGTAHC